MHLNSATDFRSCYRNFKKLKRIVCMIADRVEHGDIFMNKCFIVLT